MSALYTQCSGMRGTRTARGSKNSGVTASVQSWDFSLIANLGLDEKDKPILTLETSDDSRGSWGDMVYRGSTEDFTTLMMLVKQLGTANTIKSLQRKAARQK